MADIVRKVAEKTEEEIVEKEEKTIGEFPLRMAQLGALIRERAKEVLKFDSNISNIDYDYVDTQQYKNLVGICCDATGIGFTLNVKNCDTQVSTDNSGKMTFVSTVNVEIEFFDPFGMSDKTFKSTAYGLGVSRGGGYSAAIAQTNAIRNLLTNTFMLPTSDRDSDDVRANVSPAVYLTDSEKAAKREQLLNSTKSTSLFATVQYGNIVYTRIKETLNKNISPEFRETLERFLENKFVDGKPIPQEEDESLWIVKKTAANKILADLDEVE